MRKRLNHICRLLCLGPFSLFPYGPIGLNRKGLLTICVTFTLCTFLIIGTLNIWNGPEVRLVLESGFPLKYGKTTVDVLRDDFKTKIPDGLMQDISARVSGSRRSLQSVRLLSLPGRRPSCSALIKGNQEEVNYALQYMETVKPPREPSISQMMYAKTDCDTYLKSRGYIMHISEEEKNFPIAYSIMMYRDMDQVERLLRAIYRPSNFYCLHVDAKTEKSLQDAIRGIAQCLPNVMLASKQNSVNWAGFNSLTPWFYCMKDLWAKKWKYFINLTGQEFPLKTNLQLVQILKALKGSNVVDNTANTHYSRRWYSNFAPPDSIRPQKGLVFIIASRGMVDYMLHNPVAERLLDWVSRTDYPDETYFPTINHNPHLQVPGSYKGIQETHAKKKPYIGRFVNWGTGWKDGQGRFPYHWPCGGMRIRGVCIFGIKDLPLLTSRKELFANKFNIDFEPLALSCLEEWHFNMTLAEYSGLLKIDTSWYANMDIVKNAIRP